MLIYQITHPARKENDMMFRISALIIMILSCSLQAQAQNELRGDKKVWQHLTLDIEGPESKEEEATFRDIRVNVTFTHKKSQREFLVPAYFAADGNAANSSAQSGNIWRVKFTADAAGEWQWSLSFRTGKDVAIALNPDAGKAAPLYDGKQGSFTVQPQSLQDDSFAAKGRISLGDSHYPSHANGQIFFKTGAGSPENIFAYNGFDGTYDAGGTNFPALGEDQLHAFAPHQDDWNEGDPDWQNGRGRAIIGAINYLSDVGVNAQYFVAMNVEGDGQDVWPWIGHDQFYTFDVSKLEQWQIVMDHMDNRGIVKDFLFHETENESLLEQKEAQNDTAPFFAKSRKLYYREMIARFGHVLGLTWNLSEEIGVIGNSGESPWRDPTTPQQREAFIDYIAALDPYDHPIVMHNWPDGEDAVFGPVLGKANFAGISMQVHEDYAKRIIKWRKKSASAGRKWMIAFDEPLGWEFGARPDAQAPNHDVARTTVLWPMIMAGGAGVDWYFGWQNNAPTSDLSNEDMRSRDALWRQSKIARDLIKPLPLNDMEPRPDLGANILAQKGTLYALYTDGTSAPKIDLRESSETFLVQYYNPKSGKLLLTHRINGGAFITLQSPPDNQNANQDRYILISR